jgi:alkanesulfonate monooxygenase SsuD/methylene tetrahydromethanopterin reductase-like flavin-dependent oxidoreductase (luciferase family)
MERIGLALRDVPTADVAVIAREAEDSGLGTILFPEVAQAAGARVSGRDPFLAASVALRATAVVHAGPGIAGTIFRTARHMAVAAATANEESGGRFVLGCGVSHKSLAASLGVEYPTSPLTHVARYCDELMRLSRSDLAFGGGFPVLLGALGDKMVELGASRTDGVILNWLTPGEAHRVVANISSVATGSRSALLIRVGPRVGLEADVRAYRDRMPNYERHFARQGLVTLDAVVDETCLPAEDHGAIIDRLIQFRMAGVTEPCLYPSAMSTTEIVRLLHVLRARPEWDADLAPFERRGVSR